MWGDLRRSLARLEQLAGAPEGLAAAGAADELSRLRYGLHVAAKRVEGLRERSGDAGLRELADALEDARDVTAELAEALEEGLDEALQLVPEWRVALFRVRLARLGLGDVQPPARHEPEPEPGILAPLTALLLTVTGASALVLGATVAAWPIWLAGVLAVAGGLLVRRP